MNIDIIAILQLLTVSLAWLISQLIKGLLGHVSFKKKFFSTSGGMPSAHSASASSFFFSVLLFQGITSFTILALLFAAVISIDAMGVRYASGNNAKILFDSLSNKKLKNKVILNKGHKLIEVIAGWTLGFAVALIIFLVV